MLKKTTLAVAIALVGSLATMPVMAEKMDHSMHQHQMMKADQTTMAFLEGYANMADMLYTKSYEEAKLLQKAIHEFAKNPTEKTLANAKNTWLKTREAYSVTEAFRLSNGPIDAEEGWVAEAYGNLEGQINAWPLDENLIDYTIDAQGQRTKGNIIDSKGMFTPADGGEKPTPVNVDSINVETITALNENGGEANVASGWHAIEFLLWGQDQDYQNMVADAVTHGPMVAGQRPLTDFTTDQYAQRRLDYLVAAIDKMVDDLNTVKSAWAPKVNGNEGLYRAALLGKLTGDQASKNIDSKEALKQILAGMGTFIKSELANERIAVAVLTPSEEDEHSCFSDNTHRDIADNYMSFKYLLTGKVNGKQVGVNLLDQLEPKEHDQITRLMGKIEARIAKVNEIATTAMHFDYQIHPENKEEAKNIVRLKNELRTLGDKMVSIASAMGVSLTSDDVTDSEETPL